LRDEELVVVEFQVGQLSVEFLLFFSAVQLVCVFLDGGLDGDGRHHDGGGAERLVPVHLTVLGDVVFIRPGTRKDFHDFSVSDGKAVRADLKGFLGCHKCLCLSVVFLVVGRGGRLK